MAVLGVDLAGGGGGGGGQVDTVAVSGGTNLLTSSGTTDITLTVANQINDTTNDLVGYGSTFAARTSGVDLVCIGRNVFDAATTATRCIGIGFGMELPQGNTTTDCIYISPGVSGTSRSVIYMDSAGNVAFGPEDCGNVESMTTGGFPSGAYNNVSMGFESGGNITTGGNNTFLGHQAGQNATSATNCTVVGRQAAGELTTGTNYIAIGRNACQNGTTGDNIVFVCTSGNLSSSTASDEMNLGNAIWGDISANKLVAVGNATLPITGTANLQVVTTAADDSETNFSIDNSAATNGGSGGMIVGDRDPSATVSAAAGTLYWRIGGASSGLYINTSATTGTTWTAL